MLLANLGVFIKPPEYGKKMACL